MYSFSLGHTQNKNIIEHSKNGFIFSSASELAKYLTEEDVSIAKKISDAAQKNACNNLDIKKFV